VLKHKYVKTYGGVELKFQSFLTSQLYVSGCLLHALAALIPRKALPVPLRNGLGAVAKESLPRIKPRSSRSLI